MMSDTSWDFEAPSTPKPPRADVPRIGTQSPATPMTPSRPSSTGAPSGPPLGRTVFASPSSPSRPVGDRTGVLPPPLPSPPVKERIAGQTPVLNLTTATAPTFASPATPPTVAQSAQRVSANSQSGSPKTKGSWGWRALAAFVAGAILSGAAFTAGTIVSEQTETASPQTTPVINSGPTTLPSVAGPVTENPAAFVADELGPSVVQVLTNFGTGSGVVFQEGYIMTNNHVIENAEEIFIGDYEGRTLEATLVGTDPRADIAVLQVPGLDLPIAKLAVGQQLQVGQSAIAIGSPFDLTRTVTAGIISALNRPLENQNGTFTSMIQTDAPINPGNSGGPLANRRAEVIGINTAIRTDGVSNSNIGVGFAVPIDTANRVAERIIEGQSLEPGFLGVGRGQAAIGDVGVVIEDITPDSGADLAGLESGDRVLTVDGAPVTSFNELAGLITNNYPGDRIELEIVRGETARTISATLGDRP